MLCSSLQAKESPAVMKAGLPKLVPKDPYLIRSNAYQWKEKEGIRRGRKGSRQNETLTQLEDLPNR